MRKIPINVNDNLSIEAAVSSNISTVDNILDDFTKIYGGLKYTIVVQVKLARNNGEEVDYSSPYFRVGPFVLHNMDEEID